MILDYIDKAYYINLDYRTDRKEMFENQIKKLDIEVERYDAIQLKLEDIENPFGDINHHKKMGCAISHINLVKLAKEQNLKNVWILEDDCIFVDEFMEKAKHCIEELKQLEWDVFYFGGEPNRRAEPYSDLIVKTIGVYGAHSYIVNHTFYDKVINNYSRNTLLDIFYLNFNEWDKNFYLSKELLCLQDGTSESDLWGGKIDRLENYNEAYKLYIN